MIEVTELAAEMLRGETAPDAPVVLYALAGVVLWPGEQPAEAVRALEEAAGSEDGQRALDRVLAGLDMDLTADLVDGDEEERAQVLPRLVALAAVQGFVPAPWRSRIEAELSRAESLAVREPERVVDLAPEAARLAAREGLPDRVRRLLEPFRLSRELAELQEAVPGYRRWEEAQAAAKRAVRDLERWIARREGGPQGWGRCWWRGDDGNEPARCLLAERDCPAESARTCSHREDPTPR